MNQSSRDIQLAIQARGHFLEAVLESLGPKFSHTKHENFEIISDLNNQSLTKVMSLAEYALVRTSEIYPELNFSPQLDRWPLLIFSRQDDLIRYIDQFQPDDNLDSHMIPGGVWASKPIGHFIIPYDDFESIDGALCHEFIHAALDGYCTPQWLEEGMAMAIEVAIGHRVSPLSDTFYIDEIRRDLADGGTKLIFTDQAFLDAASSQSQYELAFLMVSTLLRDRQRFFEMLEVITDKDQGTTACMEFYNIKPTDLAHISIFPEKPKSLVLRLLHSLFGIH